MSRLNINMDELTTINVTVGRLSKEEDWKLKDSAAKWMPVFQIRDPIYCLSSFKYCQSCRISGVTLRTGAPFNSLNVNRLLL